MTRRIPRRGAVIVATTVVTVLAVPLMAGSASAAGCIRTDYAKLYTNGYARTTDANGQCSTVGAQAGFTTAGISSTIWTGWTYGADVAQTSTVSYLVGHNHSGS